jgi:hypothetical protein
MFHPAARCRTWKSVTRNFAATSATIPKTSHHRNAEISTVEKCSPPPRLLEKPDFINYLGSRLE